MRNAQAVRDLLSNLSRAEKAELLQLVARDLGNTFPGIESCLLYTSPSPRDPE